MKKVIVTVSGGVVQNVVVPKGVIVEVRDYDVDGAEEDRLDRDESGDLYYLGIWGGIV